MSEMSQVVVEDLSKPLIAPQAPEPKEEVAPLVESKVEKKDDEPISVKFATLAKREKLIQQQKKEVEEKLSKIKQFELTRETVVKDPKTALESIGMTFEDFTKAYLDQLDGKQPSAEEKIEALYKKIEEKERQEKEREEQLKAQAQKEAEEKAISEFKSKIKDELTKDLDKYELINVYESFDDVFDVIQAYYEETEEILSIEKAAEHVEAQLLEEAQKIKKAKKLGFIEAPAKDEKKQESSLSTTLTNKQTPPPAAVPMQQGGRLLSTEESLARAASLLKFR